MLIAFISGGKVSGVQQSDFPSLALSAQFPAAMNPTDVTNVSPQPQVGWTATPAAGGGWTFAPPPAPPAPAPTPASAYAAFIGAGAAVTSASAPALDGTYAIDPQSQLTITTEASFISAFAEFTTGATTNFPWQLADGKTTVEFPTTASFMAFAKAIAQLVTSAKLAAQSGSTTMPSNAVSIP